MILVVIGYVILAGCVELVTYRPHAQSAAVSIFYLKRRCGEMTDKECIVVSNSFIDVIVIKNSTTVSDSESIKMAITLLKEE